MSTPRQTIAKSIFEQTDALLILQLTDEADLPLEESVIGEITLTLYEKTHPETAINERADQSIKGENGGSLSAAGILTLHFSKEDNALRSQDKSKELHVALIRWTWGSGSRQGMKEITYTILNQAQLTSY